MKREFRSQRGDNAKKTREERAEKIEEAVKALSTWLVRVIDGDEDALLEYRDDAKFWCKRDAVTVAINEFVEAEKSGTVDAFERAVRDEEAERGIKDCYAVGHPPNRTEADLLVWYESQHACIDAIRARIAARKGEK